MREQEAVSDAKLVIVVDGDAAVGETLGMVIERFVVGAEAMALASGRDVAGQISRRRPDLILLEVSEYAPDNLEVVHELKSNPATRGIPVVAVGFSGTDSALALAAGCDAFLNKPLRLDRLVPRVSGILGLAASG